MMPLRVMGSAQACEILGIYRSTLTRWIAKGEIKAVRKLPGETGAWLLDPAEVERVRAAQDTGLAALPRKAQHGGYVYVVAFDNGVVKPGRTTDPYSRLISHRHSCRVFGAALTDWWVSPLHDGWEANERKLIDLAYQLGGTPAGAEYFTGIAYAQLLGKAQALFDPAEVARARAEQDKAPAAP